MSPIEAQVLGVGSAGLADSQPIESEEDGKSRMVTVVTLGREEERAELAPVEAPPFARMDLRAPHVLSGVGRNPTVNVSKAIETTDGR